MFDHLTDHLTRLHERNTQRGASGIAISLLVHVLLLAAVIYANETVRRAVIAGEYESEASWSGSGPMRIPGQFPADSTLDPIEPPSPADVVLPGITLPRILRREAGIPALEAKLPDTLELGRPETIRLSLPPNRLPEDSVLRIRDEEGIGMSPVSLSRARQASLYGERIIVQLRTPPLQLTDTLRRTEWHWTLIPTEPGLQTIFLQLDAPAVIDGQPRIVTLQRVRQDVFVRATTLQRLSRFFSRNWTFLCLVTLLAVVGWARARRAAR
jgi:hypothetical protein